MGMLLHRSNEMKRKNANLSETNISVEVKPSISADCPAHLTNDSVTDTSENKTRKITRGKQK